SPSTITGSTSRPSNSESVSKSLTWARSCASHLESWLSRIRSGRVIRLAGTFAVWTLNSTTRPRPSRANAAAYFNAERACVVKSVGKRMFLNEDIETFRISNYDFEFNFAIRNRQFEILDYSRS